MKIVSAKVVQTLTKSLDELKLGFDRVSYRRHYDKVYFKKTVVCPRCGELKVKHKIKRHMKTKKCKVAST
jgi:ribosomal protein L32